MVKKQLDLDTMRNRIAPWLEKVMRPAWIPAVEEGDGPLTAHKFSGRPWLSSGETWPHCPGCNKPLQLMVQLNLAKLPRPLAEKFGEGLLQFFYCRDDDAQCPASESAFEPFAESHLVRVVHPSGRAAKVSLPADSAYFPAKRIVQWKKVNDWPVISDFKDCGLSYDWTMNRTTILHWNELEYEVEIPDDNFEQFQAAVMPCHTGEKLNGWPYWLQDPQRPKCPKCGHYMQFVFQFDSLKKNIPYSFGDSGTGQIHQCAKHKENLAFGWAGC